MKMMMAVISKHSGEKVLEKLEWHLLVIHHQI